MSEKSPSERKPNRAHRGAWIRAAVSEAEVLKVPDPPDPTARAVLRGLRISIMAHLSGKRGLSEEAARQKLEEFYPVEYGEVGIGTTTEIPDLRLVEDPFPNNWEA